MDEFRRDMFRYSKTVHDKLQREVASTATKIHKEASELAPSDTGGLRQGIQMMVGQLTSLVWSSRKYSVDVEQGRGPTPTTAKELVGWVRRKLKLRGGHMWAVATIIAKKITAFGTRAQPFFEPAVSKYKNRFFVNVRRIIMETRA